MERLKLVDVLKSTLLDSVFHKFTTRSLKMLLLPEMHKVFFTQIMYKNIGAYYSQWRQTLTA